MSHEPTSMPMTNKNAPAAALMSHMQTPDSVAGN